MPVIGFISEKGGVGKTTTCYHVAVALKRYHNKSVLVIDADYQRGGITGRFFPELIEGLRSGHLSDVTLFNKYQQLYSGAPTDPAITVRSSNVGVDVVVADTRLANVSVHKLPSTNNIQDNNRSLLTHLQVIDYVLQAKKAEYDYVLIDSHPEISDVLRSIIYASDYCVSPVKLDLQSAVGVPTVMSEIHSVNSDVQLMRQTVAPSLNYRPTQFSGAVGMMARDYAGAPKQSEQEELIRLRRTGPVFDAYVTEGDGLRKAAQERVPVYDITSQNATKQSDQLRSLTSELMQKCP
ncbi:chromosome partitioning protein [Burkholderia ubonensis]|uniref:ParA family protein n=1 Tax=Burkholderia ubonensis TaxID=101571 RepID=UPI000756C181|nr:ParA family protein [Burkholderia ubonensis]KVH72542.1 chromosome partitioning protein [Burkholderia ubonensis]KVU02510.1 chromosome partitioning protein [Burkholderia ubonensis]